MKHDLPKPVLLVLFILFIGINELSARIRIYSSNFGLTANINPLNWTFTGQNLNISVNNPSTGYAGASGGANLTEGGLTPFINTSGIIMTNVQPGTSTATLLVSTLNYTNIRLSFGAKKSSNSISKNISNALSWSKDGIIFIPVAFNLQTGTNWFPGTGVGLTLPASASNQSTLYLKWTFVRTGIYTNFRIDDFKVKGDMGCTPVSILSAPIDPLPICVNADIATFSVTATGSGTILYRWQRDSVDLNNGGFFTGSNTAILKVTNPDYSMNGSKFRCVVSNCSGCYTDTSNEAELSIKTLQSDVNKNGKTDNNDFILFIQNYNTTCTGCPEDIVVDGVVNVFDFLKMLSEYDRTCQ